MLTIAGPWRPITAPGFAATHPTVEMVRRILPIRFQCSRLASIWFALQICFAQDCRLAYFTSTMMTLAGPPCLRTASHQREPPPGLLHHSDRGSRTPALVLLNTTGCSPPNGQYGAVQLIATITPSSSLGHLKTERTDEAYRTQ